MVIAIGAFKAVGILIAPDLILHRRFVCFTVQCLQCDHYTFVLIPLAEDMLLSTHTPDTVTRTGHVAEIHPASFSQMS